MPAPRFTNRGPPARYRGCLDGATIRTGTTRTTGGTAAMRFPLRLAGIGIVSMGLVLLAGTAQAVEYRLFVASIYDTSFTSFVSVSELNYGATGPGLQRIETAISNGEIGWGGMPVGRPLTSAPPSLPRAAVGGGVRGSGGPRRYHPWRRRRRTLGRGPLGWQAGRAQHLVDQGHGQLQAAGCPAHDPREQRDPRAPVSALCLYRPVAASRHSGSS